MGIKNWRKHSSLALSALLLFNTVSPVAAPLISYAQSEETDGVELVQTMKAETGISVADAIAFNNDKTIKTVTGYIVGYTIGAGNVSRDDFREDWNVAIADDPSETDFEKMVILQLPKVFREQFGLKTNPEMLGEKVTATGTLEKYHGGFGLKDPTDITSDAIEEPEVPEEISSIADARTQATGMTKVKGTVTAKLKNTIHIQDGTGGIAVRPTSLDVKIGDLVTVSGELKDYRNLLQLDGATLEDKTEGEIPESTVVEVTKLSEHQSKLITVEDVKIVSAEVGDGWANYIAEDKDGNKFTIRDESNNLYIEDGMVYSKVTGISSQFDDTYQLIPRDVTDLVADESSVQVAYATPQSGAIPKGSEVTLATQTSGAEIYYTLDGSTPTKESTPYTEPIVVNEALTLKTIAVKGDLESAIATFDYTVYDAEEGIRIHDIQGEGHWSPLQGSRVDNVEGIVTYKYEIRGAHYFHMQTPEEKYDGNPNTSEGIVVYTGKAENIEIGDLVEVSGQVSEYQIDGYNDKDKTDLPVTQINARDDRGGEIEVIEKGLELPAAIEIKSSDLPGEIASPQGFDEFNPEKYSMDFWESIEGMRVVVEESSTTAPQMHGDLVVTTNEYEPKDKDGNSLRTLNGGVRLTEAGPDSRLINFSVQPNGKARDLKVKTGDKFTEALEGVVNYGFGSYKIYTDLADVKAALEEVVHPTPEEFIKDEEKLTVAAYNVENYSANTSASETPVRKSERIAKAFVDDMKSPDIIALIEVMANDGSSSKSPEAAESYERLIGDIKKAGGPTYEFVNIDPEYNADGGKPTGNIRVGYLYNPERVDFNEYTSEGIDLKTNAVEYKDGKLSTNPGRVSPEIYKGTRKPLAAQFEFNGETVVILNNHLNSKLGDVPEYGQQQPPVKGSEAQRVKLATEQNRFVKEIKADNPDENVIVLGDMNDFEFSAPLQALKGDELTNMIEKLPAERRYSYVYNGMSQVLDHALVSNNIAEKTQIDVMNVNADYTDMHGRASDHNPVLVQVDLASDKEIDQAAVDKVKRGIYNLPKASELTLEDEAAVLAVREDYEALSDEEKILVTSIGNLELREAKLKELKDQAGATQVKRAIYNLPKASELTLEDEAAVLAVRESYEALSDEAKALVTTLYNLEAREAKLEELKEQAEKENFKLPIMHMNDTHANVENYPYITTLVKQYRGENPDSLLLHGGDVFSGTLYFNQFKGLADAALLNLMGIDAMVFGNHEFDLGNKEDGHKSLAAFVEKVNFPMLGANSDFSEDPYLKKFEPKESVVEDATAGDAYNSIVVERNGEKIGIFGLTTEDTKNIASPMSVTFSNYIETAEKEITELEEAGIDKIIAVTHLGHDSAPSVGNDLLLAEKVDGIDVIVGGHSHTKVEPPVLVEKEGKAATVVVQAGQYAENLGTVEVTFNKNGEVIDHAGELLAIEKNYEKVVEPDAEALKVLAPYKKEVDKLANEETGAVAMKDLVNPRLGDDSDVTVRGNETALGNLITDAMLAKSKEKEKDIVIAMQNGGGIRKSIPKGPITNGQVISVLPFGNNPVVVELSGAEIKEILEHAVAHEAGTENGGFLHISGMKYYYDSTKEVGNRVVKMYVVDENGKETEIDPSENYKITTNGFTGQGGDGFDTFAQAFKDGRVRDLGEEDWQQLVDYMVEDQYLGGIVDPEIEGRIIDLKGETLPGEPTDPQQKGWIKENNTWFYYDDGGKAQTGWNKVSGTWYYMDEAGAMQTGWVKLDGNWYYLNASGRMQTGWTQTRTNGSWYYMNASGHMQTGWTKVNGTWYYLDNSGAMQTGWVKLSGSWYYMNASGRMQTGWEKINGKWYYLNASGRMQTGWNKISGKWYYLDTSGAWIK